MKFYVLLAVLSLTSAFNPVYASDVNTAEDENIGYCSELAQQDGIEDETEKYQFIKECQESFKASTSETEAVQPDQQMN